MEHGIVPLKQAYRELGQRVRDARYYGKITVITEHGKPAAVIAPVPDDLREHLGVLDLVIDVIDHGPRWREAALCDWLEAAAEQGYGFSSITNNNEEPLPEADGDDEILAVVERDRWVGDELVHDGPRYLLTLRWPNGLAPEDRGQGQGVEVRPVPYAPVPPS